VDGGMSMEIPAQMARHLGATHVISVHLPCQDSKRPPSNLFQVVNRCFQILQSHSEGGWRASSDLVISPDVRAIEWDGFGCGPQLIKAGEEAALAALPKIQSWLARNDGAHELRPAASRFVRTLAAPVSAERAS
jgi:NTE family protein